MRLVLMLFMILTLADLEISACTKRTEACRTAFRRRPSVDECTGSSHLLSRSLFLLCTLNNQHERNVVCRSRKLFAGYVIKQWRLVLPVTFPRSGIHRKRQYWSRQHTRSIFCVVYSENCIFLSSATITSDYLPKTLFSFLLKLLCSAILFRQYFIDIAEVCGFCDTKYDICYKVCAFCHKYGIFHHKVICV